MGKMLAVPAELAAARIPAEAKALYLVIRYLCQAARADAVLVSRRKLTELSGLSHSAIGKYLRRLD